MARLFLIAIAVAGLLLASGCPAQPPALTRSPTPTPTAIPAQSTVGQLADAGKAIFARSCAKCHGDSGQGVTAPAVIGPNAHLEKFVTAQGLLDFVSANMPFDAPGSLPRQEYLQVVYFFLLQNNFATADTAVDINNPSQITLKK